MYFKHAAQQAVGYTEHVHDKSKVYTTSRQRVEIVESGSQMSLTVNRRRRVASVLLATQW